MWAEPSDDVIPHLDCPLCHNQDRRFIVGTWEDPIGVARCTACGLVHTTGRRAVLPETSGTPIDGHRRRALRHAFERYDQMLQGRLRAPMQGATTLDIGCADGAWLDQMKLWGYRAEGTHTEPTPAAGRHRVYDVDPTDSGAELGRRYEVVTLIDQLDRLERPAAALHFAAHHLAPGGVMIIEVPNWNQRRVRSALPGGAELGHQVAFYDRDSLGDAASAVGLKPLAIWSAPAMLGRAIHTTAMLRQRGSEGWWGRAIVLADRALRHASDASDQGAKLVMIAHHDDPELH